VSLELAIDESGVTGVTQVTETLSAAGYRVQRSFDLRSALEATIPDCECPHHGTAACDCQYAVLLVYVDRGTPITLVVHGRDGRCWLAFVEHPSQRAEPARQQAVLSALAPILVAATDNAPVPDSPENPFDRNSQSLKEIF